MAVGIRATSPCSVQISSRCTGDVLKVFVDQLCAYFAACPRARMHHQRRPLTKHAKLLFQPLQGTVKQPQDAH